MSEHGRKRNELRGFALALLSGILFSAPGALAQQPPAATNPAPAATQAAPPLPALTQAQQPQEAETSQALHLLVGRSLVITSPARIKRISIADPNIAEAVVVSPHQVLINGKAPGGVSLLLWDESDQSQTFEVSVDMDVLGLSQQIRQAFPSEPVQVETAKDAVMLSGRVSSPGVAERILDIAKSASSKETKVASLMQVPVGPNGEIMLQVRFAEVNRQAISQFGANILHNFGSKMPFLTTTQQFAPPQLATQQNGFNNFALSDLLNVFVFRPDIDLAATIKALQEQNLLEILAEPNLMTESGKEASFLAGGEFPYPILQSSAGQGFAGITIQFKEFGVRLNFTPTLTPDGRIHLKVKPEVSSLDFTNALTLQGFLIPALATNRVESEMDLSDGQSFAIAGLLDNRVTEQFEKIPGIGDIPILGKLFRSRTLNKSRNELLILVSPRIVQPLSPEQVPHGPEFPKKFLEPPTHVEQPKSPAPK